MQNNKEYWLWFGAMGAILAFGGYYALDNWGDSMIINLLMLPVIAVSILVFGLERDPQTATMILSMLYGFIVGSIIGWIYGKIKNRSKV